MSGVQEEEEAAALQPQRGPRAAAPPDGLSRHRAHGHRRRLQQPPHLPARHGAALRQPRRPRGRRDAGANSLSSFFLLPSTSSPDCHCLVAESIWISPPHQVLPKEEVETLAGDGAGGMPAPADGVRPRGVFHGGGGPDRFIWDLTIITEYVGDVDYLRNREHDDGDSMMALLSASAPFRSLIICPDRRRALHQRHHQPHARWEEEAEPQVRALASTSPVSAGCCCWPQGTSPRGRGSTMTSMARSNMIIVGFGG